jgi:hypothetical protein
MHLKLAHNSKKPVRGDWQLSPELWEGFNNGLTLKDRTVVDFDVLEEARNFWRRYRDLCTYAVRSIRGVHFHFEGETQARKFAHGDIKSGEHAYVVIPPSIVAGVEYKYICQGELQEFPEDLFPKIEKEIHHEVIEETDVLRRITRARLWLATVDPAVSGQNGHKTFFRACAKMFQMFDLSISEAYPLILEYNERCLPSFSEAEVLHKLSDAAKLKS